MITKTIERALGAIDQAEFGEFAYGFVRLMRPAHTLMVFENPERGALAAYVGVALKQNGTGGATVIGGNLKNTIEKLGLRMQIIKAADDYEVPMQHDLDLLITDNQALFERFIGRVRKGGYAIGPRNTAGRDNLELPDNLMIWRP